MTACRQFSPIVEVMYLAHRASALWLILGLIPVLLPGCQSQNELLLRSVQPPYPLSFSFSEVAGSSMTYGPNTSVIDGKFYRALTLHDGKLFVGGKAQLFSADLFDLTTIEEMSIPSTVMSSCDYCDNYILVIQPLSDGVLLECGTDSMDPYCQQRSSQDLSIMGSRNSFNIAEFVAPAFHNQNFSWLLLNDTDYEIYAGTYRGITGNSLTEPAVVKASLQTSPTQTTLGISLMSVNMATVLNAPQFVGEPVEYNGRIYFFFREVASEYMDGGTIIYSRVAMVCKNDTGGKAFFRLDNENLVTFAKARLECSISGDFPFHYNNIQDIYNSAIDSNVVFAVFATQTPEVASSAVCAYRLDEIEALFQDSQFRGQLDDTELWRIVADPVTPRQATCPNGTIYSDGDYMDMLKLGQLMADTAANKLHYENPSGTVGSNPLLVSYGERFSQIVVDEDVLDSSIDVMFIGTENGTVLKAYMNDDRSEARIVEEISMNTDGRKTPVLTMLKSAADQAIFVGTDIGVYKIPFQHCQDFTTLQSCLDARDPYCRWTGDSCSNSTVGQQDLENGAGNISSESSTSDNIAIYGDEDHFNQARTLNISEQPVNLFLLAEAPAGMNLGVDGEIGCSAPCANLQMLTTFKATSFGKEYLALQVNGASTENLNCSCPVTLTIDGGVSKSVNFTLTADTSVALNISHVSDGLTKLELFDKQILLYKIQIQEWLDDVATVLSLNNLRICTSTGCL